MDKKKSYDFIFWSKEFLEEKNVIANLAAISYEELNKYLLELEERTKSGDIAFEELVEICFKIVCRVPVPLVEVDVPYIVRCRSNEGFETFTRVSELSYNPHEGKINYGRFNLNREPIFYGVSPSKPINNFPEELASIFETCKDLRLPDVVISKNRYTTVSYWKISKSFFSVILCLYDDGINKNLTLQNLHKYFEKVLENKFTKESKKIISRLYTFLSSKASCIKENDDDYLITTAFRHALERYYGQEIKAIIYSGAYSDNHCINIALTKKSVDDGCIKFDRAIMYEIRPTKEINPFSEFAFPIKEHYFIFTPLKRSLKRI